MEYLEDKLFSFDNLFPNNPLQLEFGQIFQVSELSVVHGGEISSHRQQCDEITYAISGNASFFSDEACYTVKAGQIHFIKKGHMHSIKAGPNENFRFLCIGFLPDNSSTSAKCFMDAVCDIPCFVINDNGLINNLSEFLIREFYNNDSMSHEMINFYMSQILITIARLLGDTHSVKVQKGNGSFCNPTIYKTLRYIDREYLNLKSVGQISRFLSYSEYYLSHLFKEKMGITIKQYLTKKKIAHSCELLKTTDLSIEQISEKLMFSSSHSFRRQFKELTGMSPNEYKRN